MKSNDGQGFLRWFFSNNDRGAGFMVVLGMLLVAGILVTLYVLRDTGPDECGIGTIQVDGYNGGDKSYCTPAPGITVPPNSPPLGVRGNA